MIRIRDIGDDEGEFDVGERFWGGDDGAVDGVEDCEGAGVVVGAGEYFGFEDVELCDRGWLVRCFGLRDGVEGEWRVYLLVENEGFNGAGFLPGEIDV